MYGVIVSHWQPWLAQPGTGNPSTVMIGTITFLYDAGAIVVASSSEHLGRKRTSFSGH